MINENTPTLETERLILRKFTIDDSDAFFELMCDEEVNTYLPWHVLKKKEDALVYLENRFLSYYNRDSSYRYAICLKTNNVPIGYIWVSNGESHDFGYAIKKEFWHKGITSEAALAFVNQLKHAGFSYITATHDTNNLRSGEVMKRIGMKYCYSYVEQWQPKNISVTFRMYQLNFNENDNNIYMEYWDKYPEHFVETELIK